MRIKCACLRETSTDTVAGDIWRGACARVAILDIIGIAFVVARIRIVAGVV